jgi:hypothetical protein
VDPKVAIDRPAPRRVFIFGAIVIAVPFEPARIAAG